jgi:hypothetical protein
MPTIGPAGFIGRVVYLADGNTMTAAPQRGVGDASGRLRYKDKSEQG